MSIGARPNIIRIVPHRGGFDEFRFRQQLVDLISSRVPRFGLDWTGLSELTARRARQRLADKRREEGDGDVDEWIDKFQSEIDAKDEEVKELREEIARLERQKLDAISSGNKVVNLAKLEASIPQVYAGEVGDRVKMLLTDASRNLSDRYSERDIHVFNMLAELIEFSGNLRAFKDDATKAGKDGNLDKWLTAKGWTKREGKHNVMTPPPDLRGVGPITLSKTSSDHRAVKNSISDLMKILGLQSLKD